MAGIDARVRSGIECKCELALPRAEQSHPSDSGRVGPRP
jgi:hypothetical protein